MNFQDIHARSIAEQQREEERRTRSEAQQREKLEKTLQEIKGCVCVCVCVCVSVFMRAYI